MSSMPSRLYLPASPCMAASLNLLTFAAASDVWHLHGIAIVYMVTVGLQGDRRAGPSLTAFNYESKWGQLALKTLYRCLMDEEQLPVLPPCCRPDPKSTASTPLSLHQFLGQVCHASYALMALLSTALGVLNLPCPGIHALSWHTSTPQLLACSPHMHTCTAAAA